MDRLGGNALLIVQKYGGSSVANADRIKNVARRVIEEYKKGHKLVVVLSAQGDTTDDLIEKAKEISTTQSKRELDMLLSTGEQISVSLLAMAIHDMGYPAISLNGFQIGMLTTSTYSNARIRKVVETNRITSELERNNIVIITGFQGYNRHKDITTLGRGGSDTSAVAIAAALNADKCEIYTDVDGVYTTDPRVVPTARKLNEVSYDEMLELAALGAKVLHYRSVELAKKYKIELVVRSSLTEEEGTVVKEESKMEKLIVTGIAIDKNTARITVQGLTDTHGVAYQIFEALSKQKISIDIILQSTSGDLSVKDICFTVKEDDCDRAIEVIEGLKDQLHFVGVTFDKNTAKLSIVGAGMAETDGVASSMFEALHESNINIDLISTSEIKITVLVAEDVVEDACRAVHKKFLDNKIAINTDEL